jgi:hypothetical protein
MESVCLFSHVKVWKILTGNELIALRLYKAWAVFLFRSQVFQSLT